jgi:hypothetical protein
MLPKDMPYYLMTWQASDGKVMKRYFVAPGVKAARKQAKESSGGRVFDLFEYPDSDKTRQIA